MTDEHAEGNTLHLHRFTRVEVRLENHGKSAIGQ